MSAALERRRIAKRQAAARAERKRKAAISIALNEKRKEKLKVSVAYTHTLLHLCFPDAAGFPEPPLPARMFGFSGLLLPNSSL